MNMFCSLGEKFHLKELKCFTSVAVIFVSVLLISNVASTKMISLLGMEFDAGTLLFPLSYIFGDVLTEVYGYKRSRRVIWSGMAMLLMMAGVFYLVSVLPVAEGGISQGQFMAVLGQVPRIVAGSVVAYLVGEFSNSYILAKMKLKMKGKKLWMRTIVSTLFGEGIDTVLFVLIAFYGVLSPELLWSIMIWNYVFKVGVEILFTPITYIIVGHLKESEGIDVYDRDTNFNPFKLEV